MYNVDTQKISQILHYYRELTNQGSWIKENYQLEAIHDHLRFINHMAAIQCLNLYFNMFTDIANLLIDGFIMRDPGGYEDMVDILEDETVISRDTGAVLRELITFHRKSVRDYLDNDEAQTQRTFLSLYPKLPIYEQEVKNYLDRELPSWKHSY